MSSVAWIESCLIHRPRSFGPERSGTQPNPPGIIWSRLKPESEIVVRIGSIRRPFAPFSAWIQTPRTELNQTSTFSELAGFTLSGPERKTRLFSTSSLSLKRAVLDRATHASELPVVPTGI